ncbi:MAG TPA: PPC domain-containing protein, partial [Gaiellales bacterium]|nr:PPC domain-containing protein [Gaiellales bacterium]
VHPDMQSGSGCDTGCGGASTTFQNMTSVASHEMIETVTDAEVGLATTSAPPLAWYDNTNGEIGDICNAQQGTIAGYTVQKEFDNATSTCIVSKSGGGGGGDTTLSNGVPVSNLSGASGAQSFFVLAVPAGQTTLTFQISGGTGDADMYVRFGAQPTTATFDCRPFVNGNAETCSFTNPAAGNWFVMLNGFSAYSGVTLRGTFAADTTTALTNGVPVTGISGASGSQQFWKLTVPAGKTQVVFQTSGGTGDADLYVRRGARPTTATFDCRPFITGNNETCTFTNPVAADYFVMIRGFSAFSGVTLKGTTTP